MAGTINLHDVNAVPDLLPDIIDLLIDSAREEPAACELADLPEPFEPEDPNDIDAVPY